jgi:hypothetical protein
MVTKRHVRRPLRLAWLIVIVLGLGALPGSTPPTSHAQALGPSCTSYERLWGEWCVYTYTNDIPDRVVQGYENIYHASAWQSSTKWNMVIGGWKSQSAQGGNDRVFRLSTTDPYGIANYASDQQGAYQYIDNNWETTASADCPPPYPGLSSVACPVPGTTIVRSKHTVQPDMFAMQWTRPRPAGWTCCDTVFYSYDMRGDFPERDVAVHYAWVDPTGVLQRGGQYGDKNPILPWHTGTSSTRTVNGVSDARVAYDPTTQKFYMAYVEWVGSGAGISIAQSNWTNLKFTLGAQNILSWSSSSRVNPQIVVTGDGPYQYYLFHTVYTANNVAQIWVVKSSGGILGPYLQQDAKLVLSPPATSPYKIVGTPYVFCNTALQPPQWQMYFSAAANDPGETGSEVVGQNFPYNNQILTAFLRKGCEFNPGNPTDPANTPPIWP